MTDIDGYAKKDYKPTEKKIEKATCKACPVFDESGFCHIKNKACDDKTPVCNHYGRMIQPKTETKNNEPKVPKHIIDRANEILEKEDPIKFIFDTHQKMHIKDETLTLARIAAVGNQSVLNSKGIQPAADGGSGKGKSDGDKKFVHLIPPEYVLTGSISDKVLYYKKDLLPGTYIYSDDVMLSEDLTSTIKRATSNFQQKTPHHTLDKDRNVISNEIPERIIWGLNSIDNVSSLQLINRQFGVSVDESPEQDIRVFNYQQMCGLFGIEELPVTEEVLICREIIRDIKKYLFRVLIPYNYLIEWRDASNRRNFDMFEDMIRGFAVYKYRQRERQGNILFAEFEDFDNAITLYNKRTEQQGRKLTDSELCLVKAISAAGVSDCKILQKMTGLTAGRITQLIRGKGKDNDSGLIHKVKGLHCERTTEKIADGTISKMYYSITGFDEKQYKESVVWIDDKAKEELLGIYRVFTGYLLKKINNSEEVFTIYTLFNNIHNNNKYNNLLETFILGKPGETGKKGKYLTTDSEQKSKYLVNTSVNTSPIYPDDPKEYGEFLEKYFISMGKPETEQDLKYRVSQAETIFATKFKLNTDKAHKIVVDYCTCRGWC